MPPSSQYFRKLLEISRNDPAVVAFNVGTAIGLAGFIMTDPVNLRTCCVVSGISNIFYNMTRKPCPLLVPTYWSLAFMSANIINIYRLLLSRSNVELTDEQDMIYTKHFIDYGIRPREFLTLIQSSRIVSYKKGTYLRCSKQPCLGINKDKEKVFLLLKGTIEVRKYNEIIGTMFAENPLCFLGEMSLQKDSHQRKHQQQLSLQQKQEKTENEGSLLLENNYFPNSIDAVAKTDIRLLEWDRDYLLELLRKDDVFSNRLQSVFFQAVRMKLLNISEIKSLETYKSLLIALTAMKKIDVLEKKALKKFRVDHHIEYKDHVRILNDLGWTEDDYINGVIATDDSSIYSDINIMESLSAMLWRIGGSDNDNSGKVSNNNSVFSAAHRINGRATSITSSSTNNQTSPVNSLKLSSTDETVAAATAVLVTEATTKSSLTTATANVDGDTQIEHN